MLNICRTKLCKGRAPAYAVAACCGGGGGTSRRVFSAIMREKEIPTPSMTARRTAQPIALLRIALAPPRIARAPPIIGN